MKLKWYLVKLGLSLVIIGLILRFVDLESVWEAFRTFSPLVVVTVILGYLFGQLVSSYKWLLLVRTTDCQARWREAVSAYFVGIFVNFFGLGLLGGDVARGVLLARKAKNREAVLLTVVADRAHGLLVLLLLWLVAAIVFGVSELDKSLSLLLAGLFVLGVFGWVFASKFFKRFDQSEHKLVRKLAAVAHAFPADPRLLLSITGVSLVLHLSQIFLHAVMFWGLDAQFSWPYLLLSIPVINILSSLPLTWNGVGVRESGYLFFFAELHPILSHEQALACGLLWLVAVTCGSALGGLLILISKGAPLKRLEAVEEGPPPTRVVETSS